MASEMRAAQMAQEYSSNIGYDTTLAEVLADTEYLDTDAHCPGCRCEEKRELPKVRAEVRKVGKRVVRKTFVGSFQI